MRAYISHSPKETFEIGKALAGDLKGGEIIAFRGGLGMGKTCFTSGIAKGLGYDCDVTSPTFNIVNEYRGGRLPLFHYDMYRISGFDDLYSTGYFDYIDENGVIAAEWSKNADSVFDGNTIYIEFKRIDDTSREIKIIFGSEDNENTFR